MLTVDDFDEFFRSIHEYEPFPWQRRLVKEVVSNGKWPAVLDLPTGSGKTAAIDIALFHLALEADRGESRRAPVRIAFVVDRRLIVDDAFTRAQKIAAALRDAHSNSVLGAVARRLRLLSEDEPLVARRLRGGIPREDDWARTPAQPTVLCSTVDQVGSRLLFRGYGITDSMKPVHAGLIGSDCLILLDEAHLAEPFRQTLGWVEVYRGKNWREVQHAGPWGSVLLTATPGDESRDTFSLDAEDRSHPVLRRRLEASKPARLIAPPRSRETESDEGSSSDNGNTERDLRYRVDAIADEIRRAIDHFREAASGVLAPAIGVVVNRVGRAREVFRRVRQMLEADASLAAFDSVLMIGPARSADREALAASLDPIRTRTWKEGEKRVLNKALVIVATQCIEAGVDIDLDALITEVAPLDALRQRFGRLNRAGRDIVPYAAIVAGAQELSSGYEDPIYGKSIQAAWGSLTKAAKKRRRDARNRSDNVAYVEFGLSAYAVPMDGDALSPKADAPVLLPAHVDLLSHTAPAPAADPEVSLYLHGAERQSDTLTVVWRADLNPGDHHPRERLDEDTRRLLKLVPPRAAESIELPLWVVRRWLEKPDQPLIAEALGDVPGGEAVREEAIVSRGDRKPVFRWKGDDPRSRWVDTTALRPGDTIVVPASYGGVDAYGWDPECKEAVTDVANQAAAPFAGRRFAVRIAPGLLGAAVSPEALADTLARAESGSWRDLRTAISELTLPEDVRAALAALDRAKRGRVTTYLDLYGTDIEGRPRGIVFVAPFGVEGEREEEEGSPNSTEDDSAGSIPGFRLSLAEHSSDVEKKAEKYAQAAGLPKERVADLRLAGFLHDIGKADPRFQAWLHYTDPLGVDLDEAEQVLAKSDRPLPPSARQASGLPERWRHEALSVRLALLVESLSKAPDPELVVWLIGTHHGYGRPFFPHSDPMDTQVRSIPTPHGLPHQLGPGPGPQSLAFEWRGMDWATLFVRLKAHYGVWELARMEAILRLADHRASEEAARRIAEGGL